MDNTGGRALASVIMWLTYLVLVWMTIDRLEGWSILMAFVLMMPLMGAMAFMWTTHQTSTTTKKDRQLSLSEIEKRKRDRLDEIIRKLSSEDLIRLKERLSDGSLDDDDLYEYVVGDDGEFVRRA